jgi:nucleoside-diphosphate-sugar epimerase
MAKVLITGASGFIGGHLAETLAERGDSVRCLVRHKSATSSLEQLGAEIVRGELNDASVVHNALEGISTVYHVAGAVAERKKGELLYINGELTGAFAEICASRESPPTFVLVSSLAAAGPTHRGTVRQASDAPRPVSQYGRSKLEGEKRVAAFADRMPITVVRPGAVFGPRDRASFTVFQTIRYWRIHPVLGFRTPPISVIHVTDLVEMLIRAAERGQRIPAAPEERTSGRGFYFGCVDEYPTYAELGGMVRRALDYSFAPVLFIPQPLAWCVALPNEILRRWNLGIPLLSIDKLREAAVASWACTPAETFRDLCYVPPLQFEARLRQTAQWYRQAKWL